MYAIYHCIRLAYHIPWYAAYEIAAETLNGWYKLFFFELHHHYFWYFKEMTSIWSVLPNETACPSGLWYFDFDIKNICNSYFNSKLRMQNLNGSFRKDIQRIKFKQTPWECDSPIFYHMHTVIIVMILKLWLWNNSSKLRKNSQIRIISHIETSSMPNLCLEQLHWCYNIRSHL